MSLSEKSTEEISELLTKYGIKHGPIVDSTRKLYEQKLEKAMKSAPVKPSSDKTFYREEEEEITYITYSPVRHEVHEGMLKRRGNVATDEDKESDQDTEPPIQTTNRTANHSAVQPREPVKKSGGGMWRVTRLLLLLAVLAAVFYYAYCRVINNEENPFGIQ
ncbi:emerin (Emery-Dreifuss muscular dystrophy) [Siniperca chuatsi]|uniref:emerin (Emery-Dreifuss muscular dystrophy) n=1 Tax=Siniperca chuatsi TaxID=119488 RepID=UPI001CE05BB9|nr:emerin (Emery-Dreifuss muscular dystrophy) [Siniperca chuatsi]